MAKQRAWQAAALTAVLAAACGGDVLSVLVFVGSAGGDWRVDDPAVAGFQARLGCGGAQTECRINIQPIGNPDVFTNDFGLSYTGNLSGCPGATARTDGRAAGERITLPGCFTGRYVTINEALSDDGTVRAFFDSAVPNLTTGVWVEIQEGRRRFKFTSNAQVRQVNAVLGCELTSPLTPVTATVSAASIDDGRLQTVFTQFTIGGQAWSASFVGMSAMRLTRGGETLDLQRRNENVAGC